MNYRLSSELRLPFRIFPVIETIGTNRLDLVLKIRAHMPDNNHAAHVVVKFPVPSSTVGVSCELAMGASGQTTEFKSAKGEVSWFIKKFAGGGEEFLRAKMTMAARTDLDVARLELGPINVSFEIPMYNVSNIAVRYLRLNNNSLSKPDGPNRWVRYITQSNSYVVRL